MGNNNSYCATLQSWLEDLARMNDITRQTADRNNFVMDNLVSTIEIEATKLLFLVAAHFLQIQVGLFSVTDLNRSTGLTGSIESATQFKTGDYLTSFN